MSILGKDFQWVTQLEYSGEVDENGVLNGSLYIVGKWRPIVGNRKGWETETLYANLVRDLQKSIRGLGD